MSAPAPAPGTPGPCSWAELWRSVAQLTAGLRHLLILDELPYAAEADPAMLSSLQHAWDQLFQRSQTMVVICGSHVRTMELLLGRQSPLFGRMTGQWHLLPLAFGTLREFLSTLPPSRSAVMRAARSAPRLATGRQLLGAPQLWKVADGPLQGMERCRVVHRLNG